MANSTGSVDGQAEPAIVYDAGERRKHAEHAAEAYEFAARADAFKQMAETSRLHGDYTGAERHALTAAEVDSRAQWHATMAVYHAVVDQGWR